MSAIAWTTIQNAIVAWVLKGSGLATGQVFVAGQGKPRPATGTYVAIKFSRASKIGNDWQTVNDAAVPAPGAEIEIHTKGHRSLTVSLECFAQAGPAGALGATSPFAILTEVMSLAETLTQSDLFNAAGLGYYNDTDVQSLDGVINSTLFEPRARIDVLFYIPSDVVETATYIGAVEITNTGPTPDVVVTVTAPTP